MQLFYFDSSALVKNYITEGGSDWVKAFLNTPQKTRVYVAAITKVEVVSAFSRRAKRLPSESGQVFRSYSQFKNDFAEFFRSVDVDEDLIELAVAIAERHGLRGSDSIQLAGAIFLSQNLSSLNLPKVTVVSADVELNAAAQSEGLEVINPNDRN